jgi:Zn-dependent peptidase ImmA (M78 family)
MAHGILHRNVTEENLRGDLKAIETQAFRLASAFLMPSTSYPLEVKAPSLASFLALKSRWRVSIKAQIKRTSDFDAIDGDYATHLYKLYSAKSWSREEPLDRGHWELQQPSLLSEAMCIVRIQKQFRVLLFIDVGHIGSPAIYVKLTRDC